MYNKIAQIILNSGKAAGASSVFVSQPDANKENLAGKIFIIAEIGGKKSDGEKIINFLISELNENYYNDEKINFRDKIEGLKIENIFEAALAKVNKNLTEFLNNQKIKINAAATSVTVGVIYENKLHFAGFGKNRSLLIYRRADGYEIINVETSAENSSTPEDHHPSAGHEDQAPKIAGLFSSVISGEIPLGSYFVFASESLPEYLSGREMVEIITKLPPIVAAEQIKNALLKMNTYVPFLGVIIKNTTDSGGQEIKEISEEVLTAHNSISSLNSTEQRTEQMLAPAGIISFKKISSLVSGLMHSWRAKQQAKSAKKTHYPTTPTENNNYATPAQEKERTASLNLPSASSFLKPSKIKLKQQSSRLFHNVGQLAKASPALIHKSFWSGLAAGAVAWVKNLNKKNRLLFLGLIIVVIVFSVSIVSSINKSRKQKAEAAFQAIVTQIEEKNNMIDSYLLYNNEDGAAKVLVDAEALVASLPQNTKEQQAQYQTLSADLRALQDKVKKITRVENLEKVTDLSALGVSSLVFTENKLYGTSGGTIQTIDFTADKVNATEATASGTLISGKSDGKGAIFYHAGTQILKFNLKDNKVSAYDIKDYNENDRYSNLNIFNSSVYLAAAAKNQIYKYSGATFGTRADWLKETVDLSKTVDLYIDGSIFALSSDGRVDKYRLGKKEASYANRALDPATSDATKILGDQNQLYILDSANKRLAIVAKSDGHLMNQYIFNSLPALNDFALDDANKTIYLLSGETVYKLAL